jgi:hypothetical protein
VSASTDTLTFNAEFRSGVRATLTVSMRGMDCDWHPDFPKSLPVPDREAFIETYRAWRDECLTEFARTHSLTIHSFRIAGVDCIAFASDGRA